jgi:hypothetical protein
LDLLLSLIVLIAGLAITSAVLAHAPEKSPHLAKAGSDVVALLDSSGDLGSMDARRISTRINETLPRYHGMDLRIICGSSNLTLGTEPPSRSSTNGGSRFFIDDDGDDCVARWRVWR